MSPVWDLPRLAAELQDWYNRISQIWAAKELCQSFLTGNQPHTHTHTPEAPLTPAPFGEPPLQATKVPKLRKCSPTPAPSSTKKFKGVRRRKGNRDVPSCLDPKGSSWVPGAGPRLPQHSRCCSTRRSPPSARSCSHTNPPRRSGRRICSAWSGTWGKKERGRLVMGTGEERAAHPKGTPLLAPVAPASPAQRLTRLLRTHPLPNTHPTAQEFLSPLAAGVANRPRKCSWTLRMVTSPWH